MCFEIQHQKPMREETYPIVQVPHHTVPLLRGFVVATIVPFSKKLESVGNRIIQSSTILNDIIHKTTIWINTGELRLLRKDIL